MMQIHLARPTHREGGSLTTIDETHTVFVPVSIAISIGSMTMLVPEDVAEHLRRRSGAPGEAENVGSSADDGAAWRELEEDLLSTAELMEIHEYLNSIGQASA